MLTSTPLRDLEIQIAQNNQGEKGIIALIVALRLYRKEVVELLSRRDSQGALGPLPISILERQMNMIENLMFY